MGDTTATHNATEQPRRLRAYRFCLDPTDAQTTLLQQHAGASRWAFNHAHAQLLTQWMAFSERVQQHVQKTTGLSTDQLADLPKKERHTINKKATKTVQAESAERRADLTVLDHHRKHVTHKGKPTLDPGDPPSPDASLTAHRLFLRRLELAELQHALVIEHLNLLGRTSSDPVDHGRVPGENNETIILSGPKPADDAPQEHHERHHIRDEIREHQLRAFNLAHRLYLRRVELTALQQQEQIVAGHRGYVERSIQSIHADRETLRNLDLDPVMRGPDSPLSPLDVPGENAPQEHHELHQRNVEVWLRQMEVVNLAERLHQRRFELAKQRRHNPEESETQFKTELDTVQQPNTYEQERATELSTLNPTDPTGEYKTQRKRELDSIRPQVIELKKDLIAQGAYRPSDQDLATLWRGIRDLPKEEGGSPWHDQVNIYAFTTGFTHADTAWKNWMSSATGKRAGRRMGQPRFKKKGRARDSFTLFGDTIRLATYRRLNLPRIGEVRMHESGKRIQRSLNKGGILKSVTVSRGAHRWYASVLVDEPFTPPEPTRKQQANGTIGVNFGVRTMAALSNGELVANPRHLEHAERDIKTAQKAVSRSERGSNRRNRKVARLAWLQHQVAEQRKANLHQLTKKLATTYAVVATQDFDLVGMTKSARGTVDNPGSGVRIKAQLNRALLGVGIGEANRQLGYKTGWYGSTHYVVERFEPVGQTCATCGTMRAKLSPSQRVFTCPSCGASRNRDVNEAMNTKATAVAPDRGSTLKARGGHVSPHPLGDEAAVSEAGRPDP